MVLAVGMLVKSDGLPEPVKGLDAAHVVAIWCQSVFLVDVNEDGGFRVPASFR